MSWFAFFNICSCYTYWLAGLQSGNSANCNDK